VIHPVLLAGSYIISWSRVLEGPTIFQLVYKFPAFNKTLKLITVFTKTIISFCPEADDSVSHTHKFILSKIAKTVQ